MRVKKPQNKCVNKQQVKNKKETDKWIVDFIHAGMKCAALQCNNVALETQSLIVIVQKHENIVVLLV